MHSYLEVVWMERRTRLSVGLSVMLVLPRLRVSPWCQVKREGGGLPG
jgi:hypothetical protein